MNIIQWLNHRLCGAQYVIVLGVDRTAEVRQCRMVDSSLYTWNDPEDRANLRLYDNGQAYGSQVFKRWLPLTWDIPSDFLIYLNKQDVTDMASTEMEE